MRVLSLFSGVGGMDLGLERAGHTVVAMCEIDKHARGVLAHHWPNIPLHEDVTTLDGSQYRGSVDIVSGGSPCQDLSVAGRRAGLDGARSGLFWHQCRIADECAAPWFLWENVPGALSSNLGADFAAVLWGITGAFARVPDGGWHNSGVIVGPKRWAVWRVLDAQYFGVAQRRRRVFVVGGPRGDCRPEILLEQQGMPGDHPPSQTPGEVITTSLTGGLGNGGPDAAHAQANWLIPATYVKAVRSGARDPAFDNNSETRATVLAFRMQAFGQYDNDNTASALKQRDYKDATDLITGNTGVRRLTPIECERLMGWPDNWTLHSVTGPQADSHRYRQTGNGVVANITHWIGSRM